MSDRVAPSTAPWASAHDPALAAAVLDASPAATFVVDADARVLLLNRAARRALGLDPADDAGRILGQKGGDLLGCVNALASPTGCGGSPACHDCVVRGAVRGAAAGSSIVRGRTSLQVERPEGFDEVSYLVSAAPARIDGRAVVILTLEDLSELAMLTSFLPICFHCRRVRDGENLWRSVEEYLKARGDIDFTHILCSQCLEKHYPDGAARAEGERT